MEGGYLDLIFLIVNAGMNEGNTGWSTTNWGGSNDGDDIFQVTVDPDLEGTRGKPFYERWTKNVPLVGKQQIYQTVTGLPGGFYELYFNTRSCRKEEARRSFSTVRCRWWM